MNHSPFAPISYDDVFRVVCEAIAEVALLPVSHVRTLDDLTGLFDSVQSLEVAIIVEKELGLSLEDVELMEDPRIEAICEKLFQMLSVASKATSSARAPEAAVAMGE